MNVLTINNVSKYYGRIKALDELNLSVEAGSVYGILGPNGSGKTTTLGIIMGILHADSGDFEWFGGKEGVYHRKKIGAILETPNFYPYLDADQNLEIIQKIKKSNTDNIEELLTLVNLIERRKSRFATYSLGMKQRLAIAATLIGNPEVLIFDEPTNGLDPQGIADVRGILSRIAQMGKTVIMASHLLDEVEKVCSHVAILRKGKLLASGRLGEIINSNVTLEIGAVDIDQLKVFLAGVPYIKDIRVNKTFLEATVDANAPYTEISKLAMESGHVLTHLVMRKNKLETEFLEIVKQKQP